MKKKMLAAVMALVLAFAPVAAFAAETEAYNGYEAYEAYEQEIEAVDLVISPFDWLRDILGDMRNVVLTPEAMALVLEDFDYLVEMILEVAPTRNILSRRVGMPAEDFFGAWRGIIEANVPVPSLLSVLEGGRWAEANDDDLYIAADYLYTVLLLISIEVGSLGHFSPQPYELVSQTFLAGAQIMYHGIELSEEEIDALVELGLTLDQVAGLLDAAFRFQQLHYDIYNTPSVLWFYDIDPSEFDMYLDPSAFLGFEDPNNVTTYIIEEGSVAYLRIASFLGNMVFDSETLLPFYEEIQDFDHLIIDLRGNGGGWVAYFPSLVFGMLMDEEVLFSSYEFFVAAERTEGFFINPSSMVGGILYDIVPVAEFLAERNMPYFNQADLVLLDYVIIRYDSHVPSEYATPFGGKIWLLVDGGSASASENAANLSMATGFATVVGEPTAGVTGVLYTFAAMPNTGILFRIDLGYTVDQYGRSIEEFGVIPQILNAPGMDALETVLAIISGVEVEALEEVDPIIVINGVEYIALRFVANMLGLDVEWDGENNAVLILFDGEVLVVVYVSEYGTINDDGTVFITVEFAEELFAA